MNKKSTTHIKLGIFITGGLVLFAAAIYVIGMNQQFFNKSFHIYGIFKDVSGLQDGNNVRFAGIKVGIVESVIMDSDTSVRVDISIDENVKQFIKKDAVASIGTESLMGNKAIIITPGNGNLREINNGDTIKTTPPLDIDRMLDKVMITNDNLAQITGDLSEIVHTILAGKGMVGQLLMDTTYLKIPVDNAIRATNDLQEIVSSIRSGEGVLGMLIADSMATRNIDTTLINLKEGSRNLKNLTEQAKKSFLLWGF